MIKKFIASLYLALLFTTPIFASTFDPATTFNSYEDYKLLERNIDYEPAYNYYIVTTTGEENNKALFFNAAQTTTLP